MSIESKIDEILQGIPEVYERGISDGMTRELRPATETNIGGVIIGENLSVTPNGTVTVKTASKISLEEKLPAKSSDVAKCIDDAYMTNEEIDELLANFN